jgi:hypothetical protein
MLRLLAEALVDAAAGGGEDEGTIAAVVLLLPLSAIAVASTADAADGAAEAAAADAAVAVAPPLPPPPPPLPPPPSSTCAFACACSGAAMLCEQHVSVHEGEGRPKGFALKRGIQQNQATHSRETQGNREPSPPSRVLQCRCAFLPFLRPFPSLCLIAGCSLLLGGFKRTKSSPGQPPRRARPKETTRGD